MNIKKFIQSKVDIDYFFIYGNLNLNKDYFIDKIDKGIKENNNQNFNTNVKGFMTSWNYFLNDPEFLKLIIPMLDFIDEEKIPVENFALSDAWGIKNVFSSFTQCHDHRRCKVSGALYLNKSTQDLHFPQINQTIKADTGNFVIFSSFLKHLTPKRISDLNEVKYGLAFNLK